MNLELTSKNLNLLYFILYNGFVNRDSTVRDCFVKSLKESHKIPKEFFSNQGFLILLNEFFKLENGFYADQEKQLIEWLGFEPKQEIEETESNNEREEQLIDNETLHEERTDN